MFLDMSGRDSLRAPRKGSRRLPPIAPHTPRDSHVTVLVVAFSLLLSPLSLARRPRSPARRLERPDATICDVHGCPDCPFACSCAAEAFCLTCCFHRSRSPRLPKAWSCRNKVSTACISSPPTPPVTRLSRFAPHALSSLSSANRKLVAR